VLAAGADALLGVARPLELGERRVGVHGPREDGLELAQGCRVQYSTTRA